MKASVIIPAGGIGSRFGGEIPKQFVELNGMPLIIHTIRIFDKIDDVEAIVVPVHNEWFSFMKELVVKYDLTKVKEVIIGGQDRQDSVCNGLQSKYCKDSEMVLVHDAVRPFAEAKMIQKIIDATEDFGAVIPTIAPQDTIKEKNNKDIIVKTLDRSKICRVQTPQGFWYDIISAAYEKANLAGFKGTDEASLVEFIGYKVSVVEGEESNIKITTPFDLKVAQLIMNEKQA